MPMAQIEILALAMLRETIATIPAAMAIPEVVEIREVIRQGVLRVALEKRSDVKN